MSNQVKEQQTVRGSEEEEEKEDTEQYLQKENAALKRLLLKSWKAQGKIEFDEIPDFIRKDHEFMASVVESGVVEWKTTSSRIPEEYHQQGKQQQDEVEIVCKAFARNQRHIPKRPRPRNAAILCYDLFSELSEPHVHWRDLPYHLQTNEKVIDHALRSTRHGPEWKQIHHQLRSNEALILTALRYGKIKFEDVPEHLKRTHVEFAFYGIQHDILQADECPCVNHEFLKEKVRNGELTWAQLPPSLREDIDFAHSTSTSVDTELVREILEYSEELRHDRTYWRGILKSNTMKESERSSIISKLLPPPLFSDKSFMIEVCSISSDAFELAVKGNLSNDRDFLETVLSQNTFVLMYFPHDTQLLHRDLVLQTLPQFAARILADEDAGVNIYRLTKCIRPDFWFEGDFAISWAKSGLGFPNFAEQNVVNTWMKVRKLCLNVAIHSKSLKWVDRFTDDLSFMLEVLDCHPGLYPQGGGTVKADYRAMAVAFASCPEIAKDTLLDLHVEGKDDQIESFLRYLRGQLEPFETFRTLILGSMLSTQSVEQTGTTLTLLNQGHETSAMYKREIAAYIGIPSGKRIWRLQQALQNTLEAVAPWYSPTATKN